ncbi:MAG: aminotransferase class III-fold pyridoxal phosphate-dependent enzyme [Bacteroidota bacterium]
MSVYASLNLDLEAVHSLVNQHFGLSGIISPMTGEVDFNYQLETAEGQQLLVKISRPDTDVAALDFQLAMMQHLEGQESPLDFPRAIPDKEGRFRTPIGARDSVRWLRLQTWVSGRLIKDVTPQSADLRHKLGRACGHMQVALTGFDHPGAHRAFMWDPSQGMMARQWREFITDVEQLELVDYFWDYHESILRHILPNIPQGVNHNDAHELNVIVSENFQHPDVQGFIDFGDAVYTHQINELAIACAYACMHLPDPLQAAVEVVAGFHATRPLGEKELEALYGLVAARLVISVARAAYNAHLEPENEYLQISAAPAWALLKKWKQIHPKFARYRFRAVCGYIPISLRTQFDEWREKMKPEFHLPFRLLSPTPAHLDLSVDSLDLGHYGNYTDDDAFSQKIKSLIGEADYGWGGYGEVRPFYTSDAYNVEGNDGPQWRTVHLGEDYWAPVGTSVVAIADGVLHAIRDNAGARNYGPTLVLKHTPTPDLTYYSLYGHLDQNSLALHVIGGSVKAGEVIGHLGNATENGGWPPHLHLQLFLDPLWDDGDFPGVAFPHTAEIWKALCPPIFAEGSSLEGTGKSIIDIRQAHLAPNLSLSYDRPLHMVRGMGAYLIDNHGQRFLDTVNNVAHVGHEHPVVVAAGQRQMSLLNTNTRYLHRELTAYAEELLATFPPELEVCFFVNSGSEANELALRLARTWSGQQDMIAVEVGYHGNTGGCIDISSYKFDGKGGQGAPDHVQVVPMPDTYRGLYRADDPKAGEKYAQHVAEAVKRIQAKGRGVAGFICESILSCGGQIVLPPNYLKNAFQAVRAAGGLCIMDEVQVGFGRVGQHFWGFELQGVVPDVVTMGKPIGNGHPLAAVVTTRAVADAFANGMEFFNTFGGNPVSSAIGRAVLRLVQEEGLQAHAAEIGDYLLKGLRELQADFPLIGDVRGHGLFLGIELVRNQESLEPADTETSYLANRMRQRGILMSTDGPHHNILKIKPPMVFGRLEADFLLTELRTVMKEDFLEQRN